MIKVIWAAHRKPGLSDDAFYGHWRNVHAPLAARCTTMRRYIQHHTLPEARDGAGPDATHDGASISWFDDIAGMLESYASPEWNALREDSANLFDPASPMAVVIGAEHVVLDGSTNPDIVKLITLHRRHPDVPPETFTRLWHDAHLERCSQIPDLRRSVQNFRVPEVDDPHQLSRRMTHDVWTEDWFDDLDALRRATSSAPWQPLTPEGTPMLDGATALVIAREHAVVT